MPPSATIFQKSGIFMPLPDDFGFSIGQYLEPDHKLHCGIFVFAECVPR